MIPIHLSGRLLARYFDVKQNPIMINKDGLVCRLDTNHLLVKESVGYQLSEEAIELTEVSFLDGLVIALLLRSSIRSILK